MTLPSCHPCRCRCSAPPPCSARPTPIMPAPNRILGTAGDLTNQYWARDFYYCYLGIATHIPGAFGLIPAQKKPLGQSSDVLHSPSFGQFATQMPGALGFIPAQCCPSGQGLYCVHSCSAAAGIDEAANSDKAANTVNVLGAILWIGCAMVSLQGAASNLLPRAEAGEEYPLQSCQSWLTGLARLD